MSQLSNLEMLEELKNFDTPSITNVVATYPTSDTCLALYNPWSENWYTDTSIRCMYPELGRLIGYAVTCVYGLPDPNFSQLSFMDVVDALDASPKPTVLVLQQKFPPEIADKVGLAGGNMVSAMKALGCVGLISNGPSRDLDEIRPMGFQYMLTGVTAGHGNMAVHAINVPVSVGGMDVAPGELIHMDENGAVKFPADKLDAVLENARKLQAEEEARMSALQQATSATDVRAIYAGKSYGAERVAMTSDKSCNLGIMFRREYAPEILSDFARRAEAAGFDELWIVEDCFWKRHHDVIPNFAGAT